MGIPVHCTTLSRPLHDQCLPIGRRAFLMAPFGPALLRAQFDAGPCGTLVYVQTKGLFVRNLPAGRPRRIASGEKIAFPSFSPSGRWVLYKAGEIFHAVPSDGGAAARLEGSGAKWWPDRDDLLIEQPTGLSVFTAANGWDKPQWSVPGGKLPAIFSPDGAEIAYADQAQIGGVRSGRLCCVSARKPAGPPRIAITEPGSAIIPCCWMSTSGELLYWLDTSFSASILADGLELFRVPTRGRARAARPLGVSSLVNGEFLSIAPDNGAVAVTAGLGRDVCDRKRIARVEWPSGDMRYLTDERTAAVSPAWSPAGRWIAYSAAPAVPSGCGGGEAMRRALAKRRIWKMQATGNASAAALTSDERYRDERPQWSPDGRHILFCRIDESSTQTVWLIRSDGTGATQVAGPLDGNVDDPALAWFGYYGTINWKSCIDWHHWRA